ncbi:MAG: TetR/AcrR family transcriptional regulator [Trebonia sp.]
MRNSWRWAKTTETQRVLLDAAREVFVQHGFSDASIGDVVERAGSSVGSVYHHFGGKSELYVALLSGDGPPRFEVMQRRRDHDTLPRLTGASGDRLYASILASLIGAGPGRWLSPGAASKRAGRLTL